MQDLKDIPDAVRWRFAAECAAKLPALYDIAFREALGKKYDALEQEIWMESARMVRDIVHDCSLPFPECAGDCPELQVAITVLFGPEYGGETIEAR